MEHIALYIFLFLALVILIPAGVYLTFVSREDQNNHDVPQWVKDHIKVFKWLGSVLIGVGVLFALGAIYCIAKGCHGKHPDTGPKGTTGPQGSTNNFGFKFY